ncbi:MAG: peroxiredoxin [Bacteroidales bacterium]|nr:peroxiredoxin [Bacteroidales bacterium]
MVGVSKDHEKSHKLFKEKHSLPFTLISDSDLSILKAYESWGKKKFLGREFEGVLRRTFVIDENGLISDIIDKVNTADHSSQILK